MDITFKEKSLLIQITALILVFGGYFLNLDYTQTESLPPNLTFHFIWLIIVFVILNIIRHILAAVFVKPEDEDERDKLIELKATRAKTFLLAAGIIIVIITSLEIQSLFITVHFLLLCLVASEIIDKAIQIFYYRRGI